MEKVLAYREAITILSNSITRAKLNCDDGIYKIIQLESPEIAHSILDVFSDVGYDVSLYRTGRAGHYGFFICWDF